jgi:hypothetical protein
MARALVAPSTSVLEDYIPGSPRDFPDVPIDHWAYSYVEYCVEHGVVAGYDDGYYHAEYAVTRDQMAVYIARAFDLDMATPTYSITEYFPLSEGDRWVNQLEGGEVFTRTVSGTVELHGRTCVRILDAANDAGDYWIGEPDGLHYAGEFDSGEEYSFDPPIRFPNGIAVGDSGVENTTVYLLGVNDGAGTMGWELVAVETVTVPAGTFEGCMKVRLTPDYGGSTSDFYIWFAHGVGMVKFESLTDPEAWELQSADVGGTQYP